MPAAEKLRSGPTLYRKIHGILNNFAVLSRSFMSGLIYFRSRQFIRVFIASISAVSVGLYGFGVISSDIFNLFAFFNLFNLSIKYLPH